MKHNKQNNITCSLLFFGLITFLSIPVSFAQTLAFPGAVGFGKNVTGGRNGTVYHVTNLNDSGPGSFRDAVSISNRIVVFDVSGYINLTTAVSCKSNLTIAGQTAPGEGIGLRGGKVSCGSQSNIIIRHIRIRPGSEVASNEDVGINLLDAKNIIIDHCSIEFAPWNNIGGVSTNWQTKPVENITFQNCLIANPTYQQFGAHVECPNGTWTWAYNIFSNSHNRNPLDKINDIFINNVLYNCSAGYTTHTSTNFKHDIINNYFVKGPASTGTDNQWYQVDKNQSIYYSGNIKDGTLDGILNGTTTTPSWYQGPGTILTAPWSTETANIPTYSAATAFRYTSSFAGTFPYDEMDRLIISQVRTVAGGTTGFTAGTRGPDGGLYTTQTQTGLGNNGYGTIATGTRPTDTDNDGVPDFWEKAFGLNVNSNDAMNKGIDGYANIEKYINWLAEPRTQTTQNTAVDIDLSAYTGGFTKVSPVHSIVSSSNGTAVLASNGKTARFTPSSNFFGMGSFKFKVTGSDGTEFTFTVSVVVVPSGTACTAPTATITAAGVTTLCQGNNVKLNANTGTDLSYQWKNGANSISGATTASYTATASGAYTVVVTNVSNCSATSTSITVSVTALPTATITSPATSFCTGSSVVLTSSTGASYKWFNGTTQVGTAATYTATSAGAYTVEVTNASGCKASSAATTITVNTLPTATITSPTTSFCAGSSTVLTASAGVSHKWLNGTTQVGTASTYTATSAGAYTVEVTNASGCKASSAATTITVNTLPTATITSPTTSFCTGGSIVLTASAVTSYKWFNGTTQVGTAATYTATAAGSYTVEVTNASGCKASSAATTITVNTLPTATITSPTTSFCTGGSTVLTASAGASYKWFNGTTQVGMASSYTATTPGAYTVEVTNAASCKATSAPVTITENTTAIATPTITASSTSICPGASVILSSSSAAAYKWFNGTTQVGTSSAYTATTAGSYTVEVTNSSGCKATSAAIQLSIAATLTWYADTDNDGLGDVTNTLNACTKPNGYVATAGDACPADANKSNAGNCGCGNTEVSCLDCNGTPNGTAFLDNCSACVGGTTGNTACLATATLNGASANITVTPQPFDATTSIIVKNYGMIQSFTIISASGAIVETRNGLNTTEITLGENIASGLYTVILTTEQGTYTTKIVKK